MFDSLPAGTSLAASWLRLHAMRSTFFRGGGCLVSVALAACAAAEREPVNLESGSPAALAFLQEDGSLPDVRTFVRRSYPEGVPFEIASRYDAAVLPLLGEMLKRPEEAPHWATIAGTIGAIGGAEASEILTEYLDDARRGPPEPQQLQGAIGAVVGLGYAANAGEQKSLAYLSDIVRSAKDAPAPPDLRLDAATLAPLAIQSLALSGQPAAERLLRDIAADRTWADQLGGVDAALILHRRVQAEGLAASLRAGQGGAPQ